MWSSEYTDWFGHEPSNGNGTGCAAMSDAARAADAGVLSFARGLLSFAPGWSNRDCDRTFGLLCEKPCEDCTVDHGKSDKAIFNT